MGVQREAPRWITTTLGLGIGLMRARCSYPGRGSHVNASSFPLMVHGSGMAFRVAVINRADGMWVEGEARARRPSTPVCLTHHAPERAHGTAPWPERPYRRTKRAHWHGICPVPIAASDGHRRWI